MKKLKLKPEQWTHHHTHRLYHLSLGLCFGFISLVLVGGMSTALLNVTADTTPKSENVTISALVEGVNPGPISGGGSSGSRPPVVTVNPTVTIVAEPKGQVLQRGNAYLFNTATPAFSGVSSVPNGLVFLTIRGTTDLNSTTQADSYGNWYWNSPENLQPGNYSVVAAVFDSYDLTRSGSASALFSVSALEEPIVPPTNTQPPTNSNANGNNNSNGNTNTGTSPGEPTTPLEPPTGPTDNIIFGAFLSVLPEYKSIEMGKKVVVAVSLVSNTDTQVYNQEISFKVLSPTRKVILQTTDTVSFSKHSEYYKTFLIAPATPVGEYTVTVTAKYNGIESTASDTFRVNSSTTVAAPTNVVYQWPWLVWVILFLLLLMFIILAIIAYHQVKHHSREINAFQS